MAKKGHEHFSIFKRKKNNIYFLFPIKRPDVCWFQTAGCHQKKTRIQKNERFLDRWHV